MTSRTRRRRRAALAGLLSGAVLLCGASAALAVEAGGLSVTRTDQPGADAPEYVLPLAPGGSAVRSVSITNITRIDVEVLVYGADAAPTSDGLEVADGTDNSSVGAWLTTEDPTIELAAGESIDVPFRVTRPAEDEDGGMGAVVVQLAEGSREALGQPTVQRAAIPVLVAADGTGEGVTIGATTIEGDEAVATVTNSTPQPVTLTGEVVHDGIGEATVLTTLGPTTIAPGATVELRGALLDGGTVSGALRPFLRVTDEAGVLEGPAGDAPRGLLVSSFLLLALAAVGTALLARRQGRTRAPRRPARFARRRATGADEDGGDADRDASDDADGSDDDAPDGSADADISPSDDAPDRSDDDANDALEGSADDALDEDVELELDVELSPTTGSGQA